MNASLQRVRIGVSPALGTFVLLLGLNLLNYIDRYILPGEVSLIQREFHSTDQQMGLLTTALFITYMLVAPLTGWLGDRFSRKPLIIAGAVLWSLATLGTAWVHDYWTLFIRHALVGVGEATFGIFAPAVLADFYPEKDRNRILSIFYLAIPIGAALGYAAGGKMGSMFGWRAPFFYCAIPGLLVAALYGWMGREPARGGSDHLETHREPNDIPGALQQSRLSDGHFRSGGPHLCHGRNLKLGSHISSPFCRALGGKVKPCRWRHYGGGRYCRNTGGGLDCAALAADQSSRSLSAFVLECRSYLPWGALVFFGPPAWAVPSLFAAEFFLFFNTGPLNTAIVNSVSAPVRATAIGLNLFIIHAFGDTFSPTIIGAISDHTKSLRLGLGFTLISLIVSCVILWAGSRVAPPLEEVAVPPN